MDDKNQLLKHVHFSWCHNISFSIIINAKQPTTVNEAFTNKYIQFKHFRYDEINV